jgi:phosphatidylserine/phosphatidylglycerophosphate/cardiolipin synthase-like enzyme
MFGKSKKASYSGKDCYKQVEKLLTSGKRLLIISPYIDAYYADFLLHNSEGRDIHVISSSLEGNAKKILNSNRNRRNFQGFSFSFVLLSIGFFLLNLAQVSELALLVAFIIIVYSFTQKSASIRLRVPKKFVHAKMYISEAMAIHGSANLTYKGLHENIEHIDVVDDIGEVKALEEQFWSLWNSEV